MLSNNTEFQEALNLHQTGNLAGASTIYNRILEEQPDHLDTISLLGTLNLQAGNFDAACVLLKKSTELKPDNAIAHCNLGSALHASGRFNDAIYSYKSAIELKPDYVEAYYNLGNTLQICNQFDEATAVYKLAIDLKPDDADIHNNLGNALRKSGKFTEALNSYKNASELKPHNSDIHCNLGAVYQKLGNLDEAILNYKSSISLSPDNAQAHNNLGTALKKQRRLDEAEISYNRAIELCHDYAEAHNNLGITLESLNKLDKAITSYSMAITINPHYAEAHYNCGNALNKQKKIDEALICFTRATAIKPDYAEAHNLLGATLEEQGKLEEAAASYNRAIELKPDYVDAQLNKAFISLLKGNYKDGWQGYEWRLHTKNYVHRTFQQPMWNGSPLKGKTILIHTEQGIGDNIQFVRYLPMVQAQGGRVIFECLPELVNLLRHCAGIDKIITKSPSGISSEQFDVHVPLLSLPGLFNSTLDSIPSDVPYISVDPALIDQWRLRLSDDHKYKVGIVWAGNPDHAKDKRRSCSLSDFATLAGTQEISFYCLQKGSASVETDRCPGMEKIIRLDSELTDFTDTAAVIANLDLVISVDTSVAHLAGAIGKPVWTLLPFVPDWRWLLERDDSPWYPSMRLFRQTTMHDWNGVFKQVQKSLIDNLELRAKEEIA